MSTQDPPRGASLWLPDQPLVLASGSAVRAQMLRDAGIVTEVRPASIDERAVEAPLLAAGAGPAEIARALATAKARHVAGNLPGRWVLGADQVLFSDGVPLHKAKGAAAARVQLGHLSGRTHRLVSATALFHDRVLVCALADEAVMTMRDLDNAMLDRYLAAAGTGVLSSVGCYQLEGLGVHLFERIEGNHFTILGLPLLPLLAAMRKAGVVAA